MFLVSTYGCMADFRLAPSQWETVLLCNDVSHWLDASLDQPWGVSNHNVFHGIWIWLCIMTSCLEHIFHIPGPLWDESTCDWWIPSTKCSVPHGILYDFASRRHAMRYWPFVRGIHRWPVASLQKGTTARSFDIFLYRQPELAVE